MANNTSGICKHSGFSDDILQLGLGYSRRERLARKPCLRFLLVGESKANEVELGERGPQEGQAERRSGSRINGQRPCGFRRLVFWEEPQRHYFTRIIIHPCIGSQTVLTCDDGIPSDGCKN